jgi:hypothetical protein
LSLQRSAVIGRIVLWRENYHRAISDFCNTIGGEADIAGTAVAADPEIAARLARTAQVPNPGGPAELAGSVEEQRAKIATIAQALGIKPKQ